MHVSGLCRSDSEMHNHYVSCSVAYSMLSNIIHASNRRSVNIYVRGRKDCAASELDEKFYCLTTPYLFKVLNLNYACMLPGTRNNGGLVT